MNKTSYIYKAMQAPGLLLLFTLLVAYFAYDSIESERLAVDARHQLQLRDADALYSEVAQLQQRVGLVNTYYGRFQQLHQLGALEPQTRVSWIDQFMLLVRNYDVHRVSLNFSARSVLGANELKPLASMHKLIEQEQVEFEGEFQHESDWLAFLTEVKQSVNRFALLESCQLMNMTQSELKDTKEQNYHFHHDRGNVAVKCQFRFLVFNVPTIKTPVGKTS